MAPKQPAAGTKKEHKSRISKWYKADDVKSNFKRKRLSKRNPTKLRRSIKPGSVLILLAGRFRGKRVVFLKQLKSGLLLVTGPYKINGVPLKRVNQAYVQPTRTKVDISKVDVSKVEDAYFARVAKARNRTKNGFFKTKPETEKDTQAKKDRLKQKKETQNGVDKALLTAVKAVPFLGKYLGARFTISNTFRPHAALF